VSRAPPCPLRRPASEPPPPSTFPSPRSAHEGAWYYEVEIERLGDTGACRVGWLQRQGELQAPCGYDAGGLAYNSRGGHKYRAARREAYGEAYGEGDVVGCLLVLPPGGRVMGPEVVRVKGGDADKAFTVVEGSGREPARPLAGSFAAFTLNGESQGVAFVDLPEGSWHPAVSLFTKPLAVTPAEDGQDLKDPHKWAVAEDKGRGEAGGSAQQEARVSVRFSGFRHAPPDLAGLIERARELAEREREAAGRVPGDLAGGEAGPPGPVRAAGEMPGPQPPGWVAPAPSGESGGGVKEEGGAAGGAQ